MKKTVYDPKGKAVEIESVDAQECVEHCGYTEHDPKGSVPESKTEISKEGVPTNANTLKANMKACTTVEGLKSMLYEDEKREGVLKAFDDKMAELTEGE